MSEPIHAVAFDFDGTLADTHHAIQTTMAQTFADFSVAPLPPERVTAMIGLTLQRVFAEAGIAPDAIERAVVRYRELFPSNLERVALFPGVIEGLRELSAAGVLLGIVSSRGRVSLLELVERLAIGPLFREVLGDEDVVGKKPAPDFVLRLSERLAVPPARILVVGDTTYDIEMGHAAGARTCAVSYGSHGALQLASAQPTFALDSLADLHRLLSR